MKPGQDESEFVARFGEVFEHSPWVAREAFRRGGTGHTTREALADLFCGVIMDADEPRQLQLLRAHPELACAERTGLTRASRDEQAGAGLDACSPAEFDEFQRLNAVYRERFGFPFIIAVAGLDRGQILTAFRERVSNDMKSERHEALRQVCRIGSLRLENLLDASP